MSTHSSRIPSLMPKPTEIREAFSQAAEPWLPEISNDLAAAVWDEIARLGFNGRNYGTHRWLEKNPTSDCIQLARLRINRVSSCQIEALPSTSRTPYQESGLIFSDCSSIGSKIQLIRSALSLISSVPSLNATISYYLRSLHILEAPGPEYDVSHSDPNLPFSIFVSAPHSDQEGKLRLAESIVHECMHLQLTIMERELPLVFAPEVQYHSPWKQTLRPVTGVLHGLYVFAVVYEFLGTLRRSANLTKNELRFISKRRRQILGEVAQVSHLVSVNGLTSDGRRLVCFLNRCFEI